MESRRPVGLRSGRVCYILKRGRSYWLKNWRNLDSMHDIYFITHRVNGIRTKRQTELWLIDHVTRSSRDPTLSSSLRTRGLSVELSVLDCYIDDKLSYIVDAEDEVDTRPVIYLLDYAHKQEDTELRVQWLLTPSVFRSAGVPQEGELNRMI